MQEAISDHTLFVVFTAAGQRYAVRHEAVLEMVQPPTVVPLPGAGLGVMGLINLRGKVLGLVDFRVAIGLQSAHEEIDALTDELATYEQAHKDWLDELEAAVRQQRQFRLATDPNLCAFGRWFNNFKTDNVVLHQFLQGFDEPHRRIHALADIVLKQAAAGDVEGAIDRIEQARLHELAAMLRLFQETKAAVAATRREIAIVVPGEGSLVAVLVDSVESIEALNIREDADLGDGGRHPLLRGVATSSDDELVLLVDDSAIVEVFGRAA